MGTDLGAKRDEQFGPVILFGSGGELVEIQGDRALALPPLNKALALDLIQQTRIYKGLNGFRDRKPVNLDKLLDVITRFSSLVQNHPDIREMEINPLFASDEQIIALDARIIIG